MADMIQLGQRLAAHALRRTIGRNELGVRCLERFQLCEKFIVLAVGDDWRGFDVVPAVVVANLFAELGDLLRYGFSHGGRLNIASFPRSKWKQGHYPCTSTPHSGTTVTVRAVAELGMRHKNRIGSVPVLRN